MEVNYMSHSESSDRDERQPPAEVPDIQFRRASKEEFLNAQAEAAERAIAERPPLTEEEKKAGWEEDPIFGSAHEQNHRRDRRQPLRPRGPVVRPV
jgi:hypothetical protein